MTTGENYERIETQRDLLIKYCKMHGYTHIIDIIMDNDKSGTDFKRFENIKKKARNKEIDVIVFKNSARLGRNQKEALDFVEYLEEQGVEIIFEDEQYNEEMFGLYAWFNERRARDDSKNIRRNLRHKIEEGQLLVKAIYGYNKIGKNLVINLETSQIVKEIYELYFKGWGYRKISTYLNEKEIPNPSKSRNFENAKQAKEWNPQHIRRILGDRRYIGDYVGGHTEKINFKSKKTRTKSKDEWTIIENHHKPIIDKKLFEKVQNKRKTHIKNSSKSENNIYLGLLHCGKCGKPMYKRSEKGKRLENYLCSKYSKEGSLKTNCGCTSHRIRKKYIDEIISKYLEKELENIDLKNYVIQNTGINVKEFEDELISGKQTLEKLKKQFKQVYEDKLNELIPDFLYEEKTKELEESIKKQEAQISEINSKVRVLKNNRNNEKIVAETFEDIKKSGLTKEEISMLFDKIIYFKPKEITKEEKDLYNIDDMMYNVLDENGGLVFITKYMCK